VLFEIANELVRRGHEVTFTHTCKDSGINWFKVNVKLVKVSNAYYSFQYLLHRLFRKGAAALSNNRISNQVLNYIYTDKILRGAMPDCDINIVSNRLTVWPTFRSKKGRPFYLMLGYDAFFESDPEVKELINDFFKLPINFAANSIWLRDKIKEDHGITLPIINPGIDHKMFYPRKANRKSNKKQVLCFGKKDAWKGFCDAVEAMKIVFKERGDVEWVVYGAEPPAPQNSEAPYRFVKPANDEELAGLYSSSDVLFLPSWYESFPLPPIEAMACGTPVVTTRFGTEDYAFDGKNCLVVPPREPGKMAESILKLLEDRDLADKFRKNGLKTAEKFTWKNTVDALEKRFFESLPADGKGSDEAAPGNQ